jgi:hypothetical protein
MSRFNTKDSIPRANVEGQHNRASIQATQPEIIATDIPENFDEFLSSLVESMQGVLLQNLCSELQIEFLTIETDGMLREKIKTAYNTGNNARKREIKNLITNIGMENMR